VAGGNAEKVTFNDLKKQQSWAGGKIVSSIKEGGGGKRGGEGEATILGKKQLMPGYLCTKKRGEEGN